MMLNFLPMPHTVEIVSPPAGLDEWGLPITGSGTSQTVKARVSYNTQRKTIPVVSGEEIVYTADILLEGVPVVLYTDSIKFTDSLGNNVTKSPLIIEYKTDFSGNPILVKVVV